jgi:1,4-alpha-glucan branching enzyme
MVPEPGDYKVVLNSDNHEFGGHDRIDETAAFISRFNEGKNIHTISIYNTNRTALVLKKI